MWHRYNPNPASARVGDCTVRALTVALNCDWDKVYSQLYVYGFQCCDMPSANHVWGAMLKANGFTRHIIPSECPDCYTVEDFCRDHPKGMYILALSGHVVAVNNGEYYDSWDSGGEIPLYYWTREENV